ncbi:hypothetical protein GR130_30400 [Streptomyces sp. GS7]|nr:hypothetical protein GR130_30400 [Streptomyces sp. GS7]
MQAPPPAWPATAPTPTKPPTTADRSASSGSSNSALPAHPDPTRSPAGLSFPGRGAAPQQEAGQCPGRGRPVLAVSGDGGAMYSLAEPATLRQHDLPVTWLIVDDGGCGILREYMNSSSGQATATELTRPDFAALAASYGVPATVTSSERPDDLAAALASGGPHVIRLPCQLRMFAATHLQFT